MSLFTERFKQLRDTTGKTQVEIAKDLGVKPQTISYYANGREPNYDMLTKIAEYFDVTTDYLIGLTNSPTRIPSAADDLGLSQRAIENLKKMKTQDGMALDAIESILLTYDESPKEGVETTAIGALSEYINGIIWNCSRVLVTKDGKLEVTNDDADIDFDIIQTAYSANEIEQVILEKNLLSALSTLRDSLKKKRGNLVAAIRIDFAKQGNTIKGEGDLHGNDPETRRRL